MTIESAIARAKYSMEPDRKAKSAIAEGLAFWATMDEFEQISVRNYTDRDIGFRINDHLYNGAPASEDILDAIELMDLALQRASLPEDMVLYRGASPGVWELMKSDPSCFTPGEVFPTRGFTSTTHDQAKAWKYASKDIPNRDTEIAMIEVLAPKGTQALSLEAHSYSPDDQEILLNRNTKFKVIEAIKDGNVMRLIWEVVL